MSDHAEATAKSELVYGLNDRPALPQTLLATVQHLLAVFVGIITPPIIIGGMLKVPPEMQAYLINIALFVSGVGTIIQTRRFGPLGSGLLSVQGTSFIFLGTLVAIGNGVMDKGGTPEQAIATISGVALAGSFVQMALSQMVPVLRKVFTPIVSGITITLVGLSLIQVGMKDFAGGAVSYNVAETARMASSLGVTDVVSVDPGAAAQFASIENLSLGLLVLATILILNSFKSNYVRMCAVILGLLLGYMVAFFLGKLDFSQMGKLSVISIPIPFKYGIGFDWSGLLAMSVLYILSTVEAVGDLTATSILSNEPIKGEKYVKRLSGGILCDGFASAIAAIFNSFPVAIFAQNNGVIQITGVASRYVGTFLGVAMILVGVLPVVGGVFGIIPKPVLGGATLLLFGTVAAAGVKIIATVPLTRRAMTILGLSFGVGIGSMIDVTMHLPAFLQVVLHSPVAAGGLTAILANLLLPSDEGEVVSDGH